MGGSECDRHLQPNDLRLTRRRAKRSLLKRHWKIENSFNRAFVIMCEWRISYSQLGNTAAKRVHDVSKNKKKSYGTLSKLLPLYWSCLFRSIIKFTRSTWSWCRISCGICGRNSVFLWWNQFARWLQRFAYSLGRNSAHGTFELGELQMLNAKKKNLLCRRIAYWSRNPRSWSRWRRCRSTAASLFNQFFF